VRSAIRLSPSEPGLVEGVLLLLVAHTMESGDDEEIVRIISARKATERERRRYESGQE
jgi:uncharacterized DUF497 family protein